MVLLARSLSWPSQAPPQEHPSLLSVVFLHLCLSWTSQAWLVMKSLLDTGANASQAFGRVLLVTDVSLGLADQS